MNGKWIWVVMAVFLAWLTKLSADMYYVNHQKMNDLTNVLNQQTKRIGSLNDQLIALQQKQMSIEGKSVASLEQPQSSDAKTSTYNVHQYVLDRVELIQIALDQQQYHFALQNIQSLRQKLQNNQLLSESLNLALIEALVRDQANVVRYLQQRKEHLQLLQQQIVTLNQLMIPQNLEATQNKWDLSSWFSIKKETHVPDLSQRNLTYKQLQLQVTLAQQALLAGETDFYRTLINDTIKQVEHYPDMAAQQSIKKLYQIKSLDRLNPPQLTALILMREG